MSTSEQEAIQELREALQWCLKDSRIFMAEQGFLNSNLVDDLKGLVIPQSPQDYDQSLHFLVYFLRESLIPKSLQDFIQKHMWSIHASLQRSRKSSIASQF